MNLNKDYNPIMKVSKDYEDYGSITGFLRPGHDLLVEGKRNNVFICDESQGKYIRCCGAQNFLEDIHDFCRLHKRMEVYGVIKYVNGKPKSIDIEKIVPFLSPDKIISVKDTRGWLKDCCEPGRKNKGNNRDTEKKPTSKEGGNLSPSFDKELTNLINRYIMENGSGTPDFILAMYIQNCLHAFNNAIKCRTYFVADE